MRLYVCRNKALATRPFPSFCGIDFPRDYNVKIIDEGFIYPLGGRELETFKMPDHAVGSLLFLDKKERLLFAGDEIGMPMGKPLNNSVRRFLGYMERLEKSRHENCDTICGGFGVFGADITEKVHHQSEPYYGRVCKGKWLQDRSRSRLGNKMCRRSEC